MTTALTGLTLPSRMLTIEHARERGLKILAALPYHYPRALVRAHGFHPVEVWAPPSARPDSGAQHFQTYVCSIVVRGAAFLLDAGFNAVDAVLVPHGCDALQGLGSVLHDFVSDRPPILTLYAPRTRRPLDVDYLIDEYHRLGDALVAAGGHVPSPPDWAEAFAAEEQADSALRSLYERRTCLALDDSAFYAVVRAREYLLAEQFVDLVGTLPQGEPPRPGVPLVLSGIAADPLTLLDVINQAGAHVVADDLSTGTRRLLPGVDEPDPWLRLARSYMGGPADPTRADPVAKRVERLLTLVQQTGARGVLTIAPTFCEPEQFYVPMVRAALAEAGTPFLFLSRESAADIDAQLVSRIEAFVETLEVNR